MFWRSVLANILSILIFLAILRLANIFSILFLLAECETSYKNNLTIPTNLPDYLSVLSDAF